MVDPYQTLLQHEDLHQEDILRREAARRLCQCSSVLIELNTSVLLARVDPNRGTSSVHLFALVSSYLEDAVAILSSIDDICLIDRVMIESAQSAALVLDVPCQSS